MSLEVITSACSSRPLSAIPFLGSARRPLRHGAYQLDVAARFHVFGAVQMKM